MFRHRLRQTPGLDRQQLHARRELLEQGLLSVIEAGRLAGVGRTTAWRLVRAGAWPSVRIGRRRVVPRLAVLDYVAERLVGERI